jgi:hypothetical protein
MRYNVATAKALGTEKVLVDYMKQEATMCVRGSESFDKGTTNTMPRISSRAQGTRESNSL